MPKLDINRMKENARRTSPHEQLIDSDVNVNVNVNVHKVQKAKFEERFTRATVYLENELLEALNQVAAGEKGEKTRIVNEALRQYLSSERT